MKQSPSSRSLESFRIFPYLAWGLILIFVFIVYSIAMHLKTVAANLDSQSEFIEATVKTPPTEIKTFERPAD